jgi:hypothetical protein
VHLGQKKAMRSKVIFILAFAIGGVGHAQNHDEAITARAKEFHRAMCQTDREVWKQFILNNYTKALQERQVKQQISTEGGSKSEELAEALEGKIKMLGRLNEDFGGGKLISVVAKGDEVEMVATTGQGDQGRFKLKFEKNAPYLIDGIMVEVGER